MYMYIHVCVLYYNYIDYFYKQLRLVFNLLSNPLRLFNSIVAVGRFTCTCTNIIILNIIIIIVNIHVLLASV